MSENMRIPRLNRATSRQRWAMTMIELLIVIVVIMTLVGLLLPALAIVRHKADKTNARQTVSELVVAMDLYRRDEERHRYPTVAADLSIGSQVLETLDQRGLWSWGSRQRDDNGRLLDPWGIPYRYSLIRPAPSAGAPYMQTWNWNPTAAHEARWGARRDNTTGATIDGALPFPYLWSLGRAGNVNDATEWFFMIDGK